MTSISFANKPGLWEPFSFDGFSVRVLRIDDCPWFVASDLCDVLDIQNAAQAVARLDDDERSMFNIGRQGDAHCINEPGLYTLILGSRKPEAKRFKRWVTHEVLPSIRKTGSYAMPGDSTGQHSAAHDFIH